MERNIPDFMRGYYDGGDEKMKTVITDLAARYEDERATFLQTTYVQKKLFEKEWNMTTGSKHNLTPEQALAPMNEKYGEQVKELADSHNTKETIQQQETPKRQDQQQQPTDKPKVTREQFLQNLRSMREKAATQKHRPRQ